MNLLRIFILLLLFGNNSFAQDIISKTFYKDQFRSQEVKNQKKAKFFEVVKKIDDLTVSHEFIRIKDNKLIQYKCYKNKIPFGIWKFYSKKSYTELDYNFEVEYSEEKVEGGIYFEYGEGNLVSKLDPDQNFLAPKIVGVTNPYSCLYRSIKYPAYARENGIMGEVKVHIKIGKDGKLSILSIYKGEEPHLDVEAIRALNTCLEWEPAKLNGENIESYSIVSVKYRLE